MRWLKNMNATKLGIIATAFVSAVAMFFENKSDLRAKKGDAELSLSTEHENLLEE